MKIVQSKRMKWLALIVSIKLRSAMKYVRFVKLTVFALSSVINAQKQGIICTIASMNLPSILCKKNQNCLLCFQSLQNQRVSRQRKLQSLKVKKIIINQGHSLFNQSSSFHKLIQMIQLKCSKIFDFFIHLLSQPLLQIQVKCKTLPRA